MKMKRHIITIVLALITVMTASAQRKTDLLDRGLVAVKVSNGVFVSWRQQADEYYDVTYNLYRNGTKVNATPLSVTNYTDTGGNTSSTYTVKAVVDGTEKEACDAVSVWSNGQYSANGVAGAPNYLTIPMKDIVDRNGNIVFCSCGEHNPSVSVRQTYTLNDASVADLDGDGEVEVIIKRLNASDASTNDSVTIDGVKYPLSFNGEMYSATNTRAYVILEAYKLDGTRLWWIDCGPNMASLNSTELNIVAYDWDQDGKAEVLLRGADNMIIHKSDNTTYEIGNMNVNTRNHMNSHSNSQYAWTRTGNEYLIYLEGATANPYSVTEFPLKRLETSEFNEEIDWENPETDKLNAYINAVGTAWGDNYGHRSSKYFFGAPFLDGKKASIFLARGIYTRHKMIAIDVDPATHAFTTKWTWACSDATSPFYGQGNHNLNIADVDGDGCDEIIYGSMTIDNNGHGLSSSGLGHGDALHVSDLDPFTKGLEVFACNEDKPANNLRNATTSVIYYRDITATDDGRALMGNFTNDYPGCQGRSTQSGIISSASHSVIEEYSPADNFINWGWLNGRIYWDGDLCEEYQNSPGTERECVVAKPGGNRIMQTYGVKLNNDSKNNPCFQGDILGDWREELILRNTSNTELRIYTTTTPTEYTMPSLWYDHEYRQAMVWQMCAYNQSPHTSFFLGEMEGITKAPLPLTTTGRIEINAGNSLTNSTNGKDIMILDAGNIGISSDVSPRNLIINVPSQVSGNDDNDNITYNYSTTQLGTTDGGNLTGSMILSKQGDGLLKMAKRTYDYSGATEVFSGSLAFSGTLSNSEVWMNRHTNLYTAGTFNKPVTLEYGSTLYITEENVKADGTTPEPEYSSVTFNELNLNEGSRVVINIDVETNQHDNISIGTLNIRTQDWQNGPKYLSPVFEIISPSRLELGTYLIGDITSISGDLADIVVEGNNFRLYQNREIIEENGHLYLKLTETDTPVVPTNAATKNVTSTATTWDFKSIYKTTYNNAASWISLGEYKTAVNETECYYSTDAGLEELVFDKTKDANIWRITNAGLRNQGSGSRTLGITNLHKGDVITIVCSQSGDKADVVSMNTRNAIVDVTDDTYTFTMLFDGTLGLSVARTNKTNYYTIEKITKAYSYSKLTISPTNVEEYETGVYDSVHFERTFNAGYSSLCIPFNISVNEFTNGDEEAYVAYLSDVVENNGTHTLIFTNSDKIEADKPYILYLSKALDKPVFTNIPVFASEVVETKSSAWSMYGNFTPGFSMYGKYGVARNAAIMKGGAASKLNAYSAYLVGPANAANAKVMFGEYVEEEDITGISDISSETTIQRNGKYAGNQQIIILHNGKKYRINGTLIK